MTQMLGRAFAVRGSLQLRAALDAAERTVLTHRHASGGFHLSKPYWDGTSLLVQWINPTAGIFSGDHLESEITVERGAALLLTTPSATRIHTRPLPAMPPGFQRQHFRVEAGAFLEVQPELLIPQKRSAFVQKTLIELEAGASLYFAELLAPGRVAHGESLCFDSLELRVVLKIEGRCVLQERLLVEADHTLWKLQNAAGLALFVATLYLRLPGKEGELLRQVRHVIAESSEVTAAATMVNEGLMMVRAFAPAAMALREFNHALRRRVNALDERLGRSARKL